VRLRTRDRRKCPEPSGESSGARRPADPVDGAPEVIRRTPT
jgi:hypothetical protein